MEGRIGVRKFGGLFLSCFHFLKWVFFFSRTWLAKRLRFKIYVLRLCFTFPALTASAATALRKQLTEATAEAEKMTKHRGRTPFHFALVPHSACGVFITPSVRASPSLSSQPHEPTLWLPVISLVKKLSRWWRDFNTTDRLTDLVAPA